MRRKRRRQRLTWFPNLGAAPNIELTDPYQQLLFSLTMPPNGSIVTGISPITVDTPLEGTDVSSNDQLSEVIGNEYIVKRIVGKCFLSAQDVADDPPVAIQPKTYLVACGFFVARANDSGSGGGETTPIGSASNQERTDNYGPLSLDTVREPWMWRRSWILTTGRPGANSAARPMAFQGLGGFNLNQANTAFGTVFDGPHFDVKSARRVRQDERLWFSVSARTLDNELGNGAGNPAPNNTGINAISGVLDYRVLGGLRRARNSSSF